MIKDKLAHNAPLACLILAAGQGTRMRSDVPKVLHPVAGQLMIQHVLRVCAGLSPERIVVVIAPDMKTVEGVVAPHSCVVQEVPRGTGDAVKAARDFLKNFKGDIIVLFGDAPLVTATSLKNLQQKRMASKAAIVVAGFTPDDPAAYGRLIVDAKGHLTSIVETKDATPEQQGIRLCNGGLMLFESEKLWPLLDQLKDDNAKREFYLTDCIKLAREKGWECAMVEMSSNEVLGINTRVELAEAEKLMQQRLRRQAMLNGVTMTDPDTVYLSADTKLGRDVVIGPNVFFGPGVEIADGVEIRPFCHLEKVRVEKGAIIGPFARLRPGSVIGEGAHIGNFVEIKNTQVAEGAKINHLSYVGDAVVGAKTNIGAGTITCNYDGYRKTQTTIGAGAFIGSNTTLVAPVTLGDGSYIGAGSTITMDVPADALSVARSRQTDMKDWARRKREAEGKNKEN